MKRLIRTGCSLCIALLLFPVGSRISVVSSVCAQTVETEGRPWLFVSLLTEQKIVTFARDPRTGELTKRHTTECPAEPACMNVSPDRRTLFVSFRSTGQLASFRIDPASGRLTPVSVVEGGADPAYLLPDHSGRFLLSAYYQANKVCVHAIGGDGAISEEPLQTVPTAENAHGIALDSQNQMALVSHTGANRIFQFRFDQTTGMLTACDPPFVTAPTGDQPRHIVMHPSDRWAYTSNEAADSVGAYVVDRNTATLRHQQTVPTVPGTFDGSLNSTARCEMTPDGRFVYVANRGHDSIAGFAVEQETGQLTPLGTVPTEQTPRSFTIDPTGRFLYAAGQASGRLAAYEIQDDGRLRRFATYDSGPVSWWVIAVDVP